MIARRSERSCPVAAGAERGTGNLSPRVDDCKPLWMLFASSSRSSSPGALPSWCRRSYGRRVSPWSGPFQMIVGRRVRLPASPTGIVGVEFRAVTRGCQAWGYGSASYGNGLPERCFRCSLSCVGVQGMCRGGHDGRQAGRPVAKVQVSEGAGARSARLSVQFMCPQQDPNLRSQLWRGSCS